MGKKFAAKQRRKKELEQQKEKKRKAILQRSIEEQTMFGYRAQPNPHNEIPNYRAHRKTPNYPSATMPKPVLTNKTELSPEMEQREQAAQEEIEHKKKRVAPLYNKGGYQYISDEEDLTTLGKKI